MINKNEKSDRIRYIRALERFVSSAVSILKRDDFDMEIFKIRVGKNYEILKKVEPVFLDQPYPKSLENFARSLIDGGDKDELLKEANLLEKLKNSKTYKKDKHKKDYLQNYKD